MRENTLLSTETTVSFTSYIKARYSYHKLFLPAYQPANDNISVEELAQLDNLIESRDHFEIRQEIMKRYFSRN